MRTLVVLASLCSMLESAELNLMPWPAHLTRGEGQLAIGSSFGVRVEPGCGPIVDRATARFLRNLRVQTGIPFTEPSQTYLTVACAMPSGESESYTLSVAPDRASISASGPLGALHGLETFRQLVDTAPDSAFAAPAVTISDAPRFSWRGLHFDVARHFMPLDVIRRNLDGMAAVKLNVLHWHLSDDQGFRVESKRYPKLHGVGSDGLFYTQDQVREIVAYARDRGIRVVPEFDIPGHATSWLVGYPELAAAPGPYRIERKWGIFDPVLDPTRENVYEFLDGLIGEMAALFPDPYFHIGGDEVNGKQWRRSESVQAFLREHNLKDNHALQAYFNTRVQKIVHKYGKVMLGWDEILSPDLPKEIVIQSWRGQKSLAQAARLGYRGLLSSGWYLDHMLPAGTHYLVDPLEKETAGLTPEERNRILGGEAAMWVEYASAENVDSRIWPRTAAIAERLWSPREVKDVASMYRRLDIVSRRLDWTGLTHNSSYESMLARLAGPHDIGPLKVLADVVEPVKLYQRGREHQYTSFTPLNRLVDAARSESAVARRFGDLTDRAEIRRWLELWRDNDARLRPTLESTELLREALPLSRDLSVVAAIGLRALDTIEHGQSPSPNWSAEIAAAAKPHGELLLAIVPHIQKLVAGSHPPSR